MSHPIVLVHGYSADGASWDVWKARLRAADPERKILICSYQSLTNEVTIKDIAEAFERALGMPGGLAADEQFDAIVHSTGMLVLRCWLTADPGRVSRLKHLVGLAPATFGSPLAKQGRSLLGALFKGNRRLGPDFLEAGDGVLDGLELGCSLHWQLTERDVLGQRPVFDAGPGTPWVTVFCGTGENTGLQALVNMPGTDGTVRRAGCSLDVRRIVLDLTERRVVARQAEAPGRLLADEWQLLEMPVHLIGRPDGSDQVNHTKMLLAPDPELTELVLGALRVDSLAAHQDWLAQAGADRRMAALPHQFAQFLVHAVDERGDPVLDYNIRLFHADGRPMPQFEAEVSAYGGDASYRCFHVDVRDLLPAPGQPHPEIRITITASTGTRYVSYVGYGSEPDQDDPGSWDASFMVTSAMQEEMAFFRPYTTTLIRLYLERQVLPVDRTLPSELLVWNSDAGGVVMAAAAEPARTQS